MFRLHRHCNPISIYIYLYLEAKANKSGTTTCNEEYHDFITIALYAVNVTTNL